jgi:hypothetical protein
MLSPACKPTIVKRPFALSLSKVLTDNVFRVDLRSWFDKLTTNENYILSKKNYEQKIDGVVKSHFPLPLREGIKGRGVMTSYNCF